MSTRSRLGPRVILPPNMIGFPITAMLETKIALGDSFVFSATIHFLLPEEDVLRLTNPRVPQFQGSRNPFSLWQYKSFSLNSGI